MSAQISYSEGYEKHILDCMFPRLIDAEHGGFKQNFAYDWSPKADTERSIVFQSRMTWLSAIAGRKETAKHGTSYLLNNFWDAEFGGFSWSVHPSGSLASDEKHLYGNAFALYALCVAGDSAAAKRAFDWIEEFGRDQQFGGYHETVNKQNKPMYGTAGNDVIGTPYGLKSMNTHLHLLEAFIECVKLGFGLNALERIYDIFLKHWFADDFLVYYHKREWKVASDLDSYGHALEAAFLMVEAAELLGKDFWEQAKKTVDRVIKVGWDSKNFGFFYEGVKDKGVHVKDKIWWTQAESLNVLDLLAKKYGAPYEKLRDQQWEFIAKHQIDSVYGGWISNADFPKKDKTDAWTEGYHQARALHRILNSGSHR